MNKSNLKCLYWSFLMTVLVSFSLSGCYGLQTQSEQQARSNFEALSRVYHPGDLQVTLPRLDQNATLVTLITYAMLNQPRVAEAYYNYNSSIERITVERSLPDPKVTFEMDVTNVVSTVMPGLMIDIPWPMKLVARADVASAQSQAKYFIFESAVLETAFGVKRPYYRLHFLEDRIRVNRNMLNLMNQLEQVARAQNEAGKVTLQDVLRAQIEQERLKTEIANLEDSRNPLMAELKTALGHLPRSAGSPRPVGVQVNTTGSEFRSALCHGNGAQSTAQIHGG